MLTQRLPAPRLRPFVKMLWVSEPSPGAPAGGAVLEHVLPTGGMHLVFRLSGTPVRLLQGPGDQAQTLGQAVVGGARSSFYVKDVSAPAGSVGAQLYPGTAQLLFGATSDELAERHTPLQDLWGPHAALALEQLLGAPNPAARLGVLEALLAARLPAVRALHPAVAQALRQIGHAPRVEDLVRNSGYSHRQFVALFRRAVGLAPKVYARVLRFQSVLHQAHALALTQEPVHWAGLAQDAGFSDQAHFNREFRAMAGVTPEGYRKQAPAQANHLGLPGEKK